MKTFSFQSCLVLLCLVVGQFSTAHATTLYGRHIALPTDAGNDLRAAAADAAAVLQKMTGQEFVVNQEYSGDGILLLRSDASQTPADAKKWLADKGREPFVIRSDGTSTLTIIANGDAGLRHGLYFYLEELGARFYFPSDNWTIIPSRADIALEIDRQVAPEFKLRTFFGTGAFGAGSPIDPKREIRDRWALWQKRNRFGGEYALGGHSGEAFNLENKATLLAHPEYLAKVDGAHVPWSKTAKLNTANPDAVKLFVDWTVERFRKARARDPHFFAVSVDPADGGGHCNSDECKQIGNGSASDQVFYVANEAAKAVRREFPDGWISLYGYNQHAMPPSFDLEPNIFVAVIPYAFQRTGLSPEEFIKAWGKKASRMGIYDYWSIPDWTFDAPSFNYLSTPAAKLKLWRDNNIEGFNAESTYSAGAMGIGWYLAARLMWDLKTDQNALLGEFYDQAFGPARPPMQRMLERWANSFKLTSYELAWSYRDLQEAWRLAPTPAVRARLADYGRYLEYLRLRMEWQNASKDQKPAALSTLVDYIWDIYPTAMIHSFREYILLTRNVPDLRAQYDKKDSAVWQNVALPADDEVLRAIEAGVRKFQPLPFTPRRFTGELVPLPDPPATPADANPARILLGGSTTLVLDAPPGQSTLPLRLDVFDRTQVQLKTADGEMLFDRTVEAKNSRQDVGNGIAMQELLLPLPKAGRYQLIFRTSKYSPIHLEEPRGFLLTLQNFRIARPFRSPRLYFYVPKALSTLAFYLPKEERDVRVFDPQGNATAIASYDNDHVKLVKIPAGQDGKVWSLEGLVVPHYPMEMLNAPQAFALSPAALLVPSDALH
jgi:hypothetical protein